MPRDAFQWPLPCPCGPWNSARCGLKQDGAPLAYLDASASLLVLVRWQGANDGRTLGRVEAFMKELQVGLQMGWFYIS